MHRQQQNRNARKMLIDFPGGAEAIENGHSDVQDYYVGLQLAGFVESFAAVGGLSADFNAGTRLQGGANASPESFVIVNN